MVDKFENWLQLSPSEIESTILLHEGVADAAVVGCPHEIYGEVPRAYIVPQNGFQVSENEIQDLVKS